MSEKQRVESLPTNAYTIQQTLTMHTQPVTTLAWSPQGNYLASCAPDGLLCLWENQSGALLFATPHQAAPVWSLVWSPDEKQFATTHLDGIICLWHRPTGVLLQKITGHTRLVWSLIWSPDGEHIVTGSLDQSVRIWDAQTGNQISQLDGHTEPIIAVTWSPNGHYLASSSLNQTIGFWNSETGKPIVHLSSENGPVRSFLWSPGGSVLTTFSLENMLVSYAMESGAKVENMLLAPAAEPKAFAWSKNGQTMAIDSTEHTIDLLDLEKWKVTDSIEGHSGKVKQLAFSANGELLAALTLSNEQEVQETLFVWRKHGKNWLLESKYYNIAASSSIAFHPDLTAIAIADKAMPSLSIVRRDEKALSFEVILADAVIYKNAKVVLVGDSGVGKTGLAYVLTGKQYQKTDSTHGRHIWPLYEERSAQEIHEILLWDLAGQPGYRLIHQLYLDTINLALVVFDAQSEEAPFRGVLYWDRALRQASQAQFSMAGFPPLKKFLVAARIDRGGIGVSKERIDAFMQQHDFAAHFKTSARENIEIDALKTAIEKAIAWEELRGVSSTRLIQMIRDFLVEQKMAQRVLDTIDSLYHTFVAQEKLSQKNDLFIHFQMCIDRLEAAGVIKRLSFGKLILLQPEILDAYTSALINAVKEEPEGFGSIKIERVRQGSFLLSEDVRLPDKEQERFLLLALIEDLVDRELVLREEPFLIFPAQSTIEYPELPESRQQTIVFTFDGPILNIYVTLAVRLANTGMFKRNGLWKNAVTYTPTSGGEYGIILHKDDEGHGELALFFDAAAKEDIRCIFEDFVYDHFKEKGLLEKLTRRRIFACAQCGTPIAEASVQKRLARGFDWINCNICDEPPPRVSLLDREQSINAALPSSVVGALAHASDRQREQEVIRSRLESKRASNNFDVFLWSSYEDKPKLKQYGKQLKEQGILPWLDEWEVQPGRSKQTEIENHLRLAQSAAIFFGKGGEEAWVRLMEQLFVREFVMSGRPLIPIILPEATTMALPDLPATFQAMQWIDFRQADPDPWKQLIWGITGKRPDV